MAHPERTPAQGIRAANRASIERQILCVAQQQLAEVGAAALSLRAIARELGMAQSALFRYVPHRDALLTRLIIDGYSRLGDAVEQAESAVRRDHLAGRWRALADAVRTWALAHPHDFALLYGSPVPHYEAAAHETNPVGTKVTKVLLAIGRDAHERGIAPARPFPTPSSTRLAGRAVETVTHDLATQGHDLPAQWICNGILAHTMLIGAISAELFQQLGPDLGDAEALHEYTVRTVEKCVLGL